MNMRTILSGIASIMLVGAFYTFSYCFVEDVDDGIITEEYLVESQFVPEPEPIEVFQNPVLPNDDAEYTYTYSQKTSLDLNMDDIIVTTSDYNDESDIEETIEDEKDSSDSVSYVQTTPVVADIVVVTSIPDSVKAVEDEVKPVTVDTSSSSHEDEILPEEYVEYDDVSLLDDESVELYDDEDNFAEGSFEAENRNVFAEDEEADNVLLSRENNEDSAVVTTVAVTTVLETTVSEVSDIPSVPVADVIITVFDDGSTAHTDNSSINPNNGEKNTEETSSSGEMFTAKYNGGTHTVDAYDLVCMIVNNEISTSFSTEAIKAQAIAAYSYLKYHSVNGLTPSVLVKANPPQKIKDIVSEVFGVTCYYNGKVAQTVYMASSSGYTASAINVWGGNYPYLTSISCSFDTVSDPNYGKVKTFTKDQMKTALEKSLKITLSEDASNWLKILSYVDGNYVSELGIDGQTIISGKKLRETVLDYNIKSAAFDVTYSDDVFTFITYGYGHGVGMSQNGANILAKQGYSYAQILKYYFTGIDVY